jgi:hypothetical protein
VIKVVAMRNRHPQVSKGIYKCTVPLHCVFINVVMHVKLIVYGACGLASDSKNEQASVYQCSVVLRISQVDYLFKKNVPFSAHILHALASVHIALDLFMHTIESLYCHVELQGIHFNILQSTLQTQAIQ